MKKSNYIIRDAPAAMTIRVCLHPSMPTTYFLTLDTTGDNDICREVLEEHAIALLKVGVPACYTLGSGDTSYETPYVRMSAI